MLRDIIHFVQLRVGNTDRNVLVREINVAWKEIWQKTDLPGSLWTVIIAPDFSKAWAALPGFVDELRAAKLYNGPRVDLNVPAAYFHNDTWYQPPYEWSVIGTKPILRAITNAGPVKVSIPQAENTNVVVALIGQTSTGTKVKELVTIAAGTTEVISSNGFTDFIAISKDRITDGNITVTGTDGTTILSEIDNDKYEARYVIVQTGADCSCGSSDSCPCYKILFKRTAPTLYFDEDSIPAPWDLALQNKTIANMSAGEADGLNKAAAFDGKADGLIPILDSSIQRGQKQPIDLQPSGYITQYSGWI